MRDLETTPQERGLAARTRPMEFSSSPSIEDDVQPFTFRVWSGTGAIGVCFKKNRSFGDDEKGTENYGTKVQRWRAVNNWSEVLICMTFVP